MTKADIEKNLLNNPILPIGSMAKILDVHERTLRIYDKAGIVCPQRTEKNRRSYNLADLEKAKVISFLTRNLGLNLSGVRVVLAMLEEGKIPISKQVDYIEKIAKKANFSREEQDENIKKNGSKGRIKNSEKI